MVECAGRRVRFLPFSHVRLIRDADGATECVRELTSLLKDDESDDGPLQFANLVQRRRWKSINSYTFASKKWRLYGMADR